jgi:hypothetical protein
MTTENTSTTQGPARAGWLFTGGLFESLPTLLRGLGATILIVSVSVFLFQGWDSGNDIYRYALLLMHTAGLAAVGFLSGHWIREGKGARLLLALALASVPANFAILGGFVYSQFGWLAADAVYPSVVNWRADDPVSALVTVGIASAALLPVIWLGFLVLARRSALQLSALFALSNVLLLVPLRNAAVIGWVLLALTGLLVWQLARARRADSSLRTVEGAIARGLQFLPLGVMVGRTLWLYSADAFLFTALCLTAFLLLRHLSLQLPVDRRLRSYTELAGLLPASGAAVGAAAILADTLPLASVDVWLLPVAALGLAALALETSLRVGERGAAYRRLAAAVLSIALLANLLLFGGVLAAALCLIAGLAILIYGYSVEQRLVFALGALTLLVGIAHQVQLAVEIFHLGSWGSLALLGVAAILIGSGIERFGGQMRLRIESWGRRIRDWEN